MYAQPYTSSINASTTRLRAAFASSYVITGRMRSTSRVREPLSKSHRQYKPHRRTADYMIAISERYLCPVCVEQDMEAVSSMTSLTIHYSTNWKLALGISRDFILFFLCSEDILEKRKLLLHLSVWLCNNYLINNVRQIIRSRFLSLCSLFFYKLF